MNLGDDAPSLSQRELGQRMRDFLGQKALKWRKRTHPAVSSRATPIALGVIPSGAVFGFSFSELVVVVIVALVVMGPKDLPRMLRKVGRWAGQIRRMASDLRAQSGIDDALRSEGLADDIAEIRKLARGELDAVQKAVKIEDSASTSTSSNKSYDAYNDDFYVVRDREYPRDGCDAYNALPDNAIVYAETLPKSAFAKDPLYLFGDPNKEVPPDPEPPKDEELEPEAAPEPATEEAKAEEAASEAR